MIQNGFLNQIDNNGFYHRQRNNLRYGSNNNFYLSNQEPPSQYYWDDYSNDRKSLHRKLNKENRNPNYYLTWRQVPYYSGKYGREKQFNFKGKWKLRDQQNWRKAKEREKWMRRWKEEQFMWNQKMIQQQQENRNHNNLQVYNPYWTDDYDDFAYDYRYSPYFYYG